MLDRDASNTEQKYDDRYAGEYMDTDDYSNWAHADLRARQVVEMLKSIPVYPDKLLDCGCGVGGWIPILAEVAPITWTVDQEL